MIGVVADDVTGATDVAAALSERGLRTRLRFGVPSGSDDRVRGLDAIVVALKSRSIHPDEAVSQSVAAVQWLKRVGADQYYFKYCSTFDSTESGNIGPVTEALASALGQRMVITTPSSPAHGRTVYDGYLFVGKTLLAESHMRDHPLNPMKDSSTLRLLEAQSEQPIGLLSLDTIRTGVTATKAAIDAARDDGVVQLVSDATSVEDLDVVARAAVDMTLWAGAAGLVSSIASLVSHPEQQDHPDRASNGRDATAILAGSCSARTLEQIASFREGPSDFSFFLDQESTSDPKAMALSALAWYDSLPANVVPLIYSSLPPKGLKEVQKALGADEASSLFENALGRIAAGLVQRGVKRLVTAGGETSGAIIDALRLTSAEVDDELAIGVPWIYSRERNIRLALKSGNFGDVDLFRNLAATHDEGANDE